MTKVISVRVGAEDFVIDTSDLDKFPDSTLAVAHRFNKERDELDFSYRGSHLFETVLHLYRHGKLRVPENASYNMLKDELDFWGFELVVPVIKGPVQFSQLNLRSLPVCSVACPWGVYGKKLGDTCWMPIICFLWRSLLASPRLIDAVAVGYKDINIYIKHGVGEDQTGISLVMSHKYFLQRLAELSGCTVSFLDGVYGHAVLSESRSQDLFCDNSPVTHTWNYLHHEIIPVKCKRRRNNVHMTACQNHMITIPLRGFVVEIEVDKEGLFWSCNVDVPSEDPIHLSDLSGFILRVSYVLDNSVYDGFLVPSLTSRYHPFEFAVYRSRSYNVTDGDEWYRNLKTLVPVSGSMAMNDLCQVNLDRISSVVLLIEEADSGTADLLRITHDSSLVHGAFYERINFSLN